MEYSLYYQRQLTETRQQYAVSEPNFWNGLSVFMRKQVRPTAATTKRSTSADDFCLCLAHYCEIKGPSPIYTLPKSRPQQLNAELSSLLEKVFSCQMNFSENDEQFRIVPHTTTRISYADSECECVFFTLYDLAARGFVRSFVLILFGAERNVLRKRISDTFHSAASELLRRVTAANLKAFHHDLRAYQYDLHYTHKVCCARYREEQPNGTQDGSGTHLTPLTQENGKAKTNGMNDDRITDFLTSQKPAEIEKCLREVERIVLYVSACLNAHTHRTNVEYEQRKFDSESGSDLLSETETETDSRTETVRQDSDNQHEATRRDAHTSSTRSPRLVLAGGKPWLSGLVEDATHSSELRRRSGSESQLNDSECEASLSSSSSRCAEDVQPQSTHDVNERRRRGGPRMYTELFRKSDGIHLEAELERIYEALGNCECETRLASAKLSQSISRPQPEQVLQVSIGHLPLFNVMVTRQANVPITVEPIFEHDAGTESNRAKLACYASKFNWLVSGYSNKTVCPLLQCVLQGNSVLVCSKSALFLDYAEAALRAVMLRVYNVTNQPLTQSEPFESLTTDSSLSDGLKSKVFAPLSVNKKPHSKPVSSSASLSSMLSSDRDNDHDTSLFVTRIVRERRELTPADLRATVILLNTSGRKLRCVPHPTGSKVSPGSDTSFGDHVSLLPICDLDDDNFHQPRAMANSVGLSIFDGKSPSTAGVLSGPLLLGKPIVASNWLTQMITGLRHVASPEHTSSADKHSMQSDTMCLTLFADAVRSHIAVALQRRIPQIWFDAMHLGAANGQAGQPCTCNCSTNGERCTGTSLIAADQFGVLLRDSAAANALRAREERDTFAASFLRSDAADLEIVDHFVDRVQSALRASHPASQQSFTNVKS